MACRVILVADDDPSVLDFLELLLTGEGFGVLRASDGYQALELISHTLPSVVVLDLRMPRLDGFAVAGQLRAGERTRAIPIVAISADRSARQKLQGLAVDAFLPKPFDATQLLETVRRLL